MEFHGFAVTVKEEEDDEEEEEEEQEHRCSHVIEKHSSCILEGETSDSPAPLQLFIRRIAGGCGDPATVELITELH